MRRLAVLLAAVTMVAVVAAGSAAACDGGPAEVGLSGASGRGVPECDNSDLVASYRDRGGAAGSLYGVLRLTNRGTRTCVTQGFGGLSYVGGGDGTQIGAAATREHRRAAHRVVLEVGDRARSRVRAVEAGAYGPRCHRRAVDGFRVYVPDETRAQYVEHPTVGCANRRIHLLSHGPLH